MVAHIITRPSKSLRRAFRRCIALNLELSGYNQYKIPPLEILERRNFVKFRLARAAALRATCTTASKLALLIYKPRAINSVNLDYFFTLITYGTDLITPLEKSVLVSAYTASSSAFETSASLTCASLL